MYIYTAQRVYIGMRVYMPQGWVSLKGGKWVTTTMSYNYPKAVVQIGNEWWNDEKMEKLEIKDLLLTDTCWWYGW